MMQLLLNNSGFIVDLKIDENRCKKHGLIYLDFGRASSLLNLPPNTAYARGSE